MSTRANRLWAAAGSACFVFFIAGLVSVDLLPEGGVSHRYPRTTQSLEVIERYVTLNPENVRALSFLHSLAALALVVFAGLVTRVCCRGASAPFASVTFAGGAMAATILMISAVDAWVLVLPPVIASPELLFALFALRELTGGTAYLVALSLFIGAASLSGGRAGALPRWLICFGIVVALACLWAAAAYLSEAGPGQYGYLFGFAFWLPWILATSIVLMRRRRADADPE